MDSVVNLLSNIPIFDNLAEKTLIEIAQSSILKKYKAQETLAYQGDIWPYLFLVKQGQINAVKESLEGRTFITTTLKPNDVFWGLAFFIEDFRMPVMLQAYTDSIIYLLPKDKLEPIIKENGEMAWGLCQTMITRMQLAGEIVDDLAFLPVTARLSGFLLELFDDAEDEFVTRDLTLDEMAAHIGTTREVVCRHLHRFAERGIIEVSRKTLRITDREYLKNQSGK